MPSENPGMAMATTTADRSEVEQAGEHFFLVAMGAQ